MTTRWAPALALFLLLGACSKKSDDKPAAPRNEDAVAPAEPAGPAQVLLDDLAIEVASNDGGYDLLTDQLAQHLGRLLAGSGYFFALPNETDPLKPTRRAQIDVAVSYQRLAEGSTGKPSLLAAVEMTATWTGERHPFLRENLLGERSLEGVDGSDMAGVVVAHVAQTAEEAARGLVRQEKLRNAPDSSVARVLSDPRAEPSMVRFALTILPERKVPEAAQLAAAHLTSEHREVRDAAFAAVVAIRDPSAVAALVKDAKFDDHDAMRTIIEAVGTIGGQEARDYLEFVASGHPDDEIRKQAATALGRIDDER